MSQTFKTPLFLKSQNPKDDVIVFGKALNLQVEDSKYGISRFGGPWREPNYFLAYLQSAAILIEHGVQHSSLDDIGLPAFYMQRHALELLIKRLLSWLHDLAELRLKLGHDCHGVPSKKQKENLTGCHKLPILINDLLVVSKHFGFEEPPIELGDLVRKFANFEKSDTWSRYDQSKIKEGKVIRHVNDEVALPIVAFQQMLELMTTKVAYQSTGEEAYENALYEAWLDAARATGIAG